VIEIGQDDDDGSHAECGEEREPGNERAPEHPSQAREEWLARKDSNLQSPDRESS
jgi:hypothetical protein